MPPSTSWSETVAPDETTLHAKHAEQLANIQKKHAAGGALHRALHAKSHVGLRATFHVLPSLDEHVGAGWLRQPGSYSAYVRYSNGSGQHQRDKTPDVRGVAIKVVGVPGKKLIAGMEDAVTQDFLAILGAATPFKNSREFLTLIKAVSGPKLFLVPTLLAGLGPSRFGQAMGRLKSGLSRPIQSLATTQFYSALPTRWGTAAAKVSIIPQETAAPFASITPSQLRDDLLARVKQGPLNYGLSVQFFVDETRTPIEDSSVEWLESVSPFIPFARLEIPAQDPLSDEGKKLEERINRMSFDPWHATEDFRPLGEMMRARKEAYRVSGMARGSLPEPTE